MLANPPPLLDSYSLCNLIFHHREYVGLVLNEEQHLLTFN